MKNPKEYRASLKGFAPHIHVLHREVLFILNIATSKAGPSYGRFR